MARGKNWGGVYTVGQLRLRLGEELRAAGVENPGLEARLIAGRTLGKAQEYLFAHSEERVDRRVLSIAEELLRRSLKGEPMAYILGEREFFSRPFLVNPSVLIPRAETELLVEEALGIIKGFCGGVRVLDAGTGCGCVAITLALECPGARVTATDSSPKALRVARRNACRLGVPESTGRVEFLAGDLLKPVGDGKMDVVVSNPPYVTRREYRGLPREIRGYEPREALVGGRDGLCYLREIVGDAPRVLTDGGWCLVEIGRGQGQDVRRLFEGAGFDRVEVARDHAGMDRVVKGRWKSLL